MKLKSREGFNRKWKFVSESFLGLEI